MVAIEVLADKIQSLRHTLLGHADPELEKWLSDLEELYVECLDVENKLHAKFVAELERLAKEPDVEERHRLMDLWLVATLSHHRYECDIFKKTPKWYA